MIDTLPIFRRARAVYEAPAVFGECAELWAALEDEIHELPPSTLDALRAVTARYLTDKNAPWDLRVGAMVLDTMLDY